MKNKELIEKLNEIKIKAMEIKDIHRLRGDVSFSTYSRMSDSIVEEIEELIKKFS